MKYITVVCASELGLTLRSWEPSKGLESSLVMSPLTIDFLSPPPPRKNLSENLTATNMLNIYCILTVSGVIILNVNIISVINSLIAK